MAIKRRQIDFVLIDVVRLQFSERVDIGHQRLRQREFLDPFAIDRIVVPIGQADVPQAEEVLLANFRAGLFVAAENAPVDFAGSAPVAFLFALGGLAKLFIVIAGLGGPRRQGNEQQRRQHADLQWAPCSLCSP